MPELRDESYNENKGEWFPFHEVQNPNTRSRAMYFFHNSLGEVRQNETIEFRDSILNGNETLTGEFIVGEVVLNYVAGDYLLLEATDEENHFHQRVVFVQTVITDNQAIEIQVLDDEGFLPEPAEPFTITKLTNAPKLKIKYRIPDSSDDTIVVVDDITDVE